MTNNNRPFAELIASMSAVDPHKVAGSASDGLLLDMALGHKSFADQFSGSACEADVREELQRRGIFPEWGLA